MTEDYKNELLNFFIGKIDADIKINKPYFRDDVVKENDTITSVEEMFGTDWYVKDVVLAKDGSNTFNGSAYCICNNDDNDFILLVQNGLNGVELLQAIDGYSSGTKFEKIMNFNVDEQGQCYMIENTTTGKRFVMLNNISVKTEQAIAYTAVLRKSYYLQGNITNATKINKIIKSLDNAYYLIEGNASTTEYLTEFRINIGSENEWIDYNTSAMASNLIFKDMLALWDTDGNITIKLWYVLNRDLYIYYNSEQTILLQTRLQNIDEIVYPDGILENIEIEICAYNQNLASIILVGAVLRDDYYYPVIAYATHNGSIINTFLKKVYTDAPHSTNVIKSELEIQAIDGIICCMFLIDTSDSSLTGVYGYSDVFFFDNEIVAESVSQAVNFSSNRYIFLIQKVFNLYTYNFDYIDILDVKTEKNIVNKIVYNALNYNGKPFESADMLVPATGNLYNISDDLIFARNLYNKNINKNIITSTLQVPNTMLNNITIANKDLLSENNMSLIVDSAQINKNIYETLNINFINKITIVNENDSDNPVENLEGAVRLANSIANLADYDSAKETNINIIYTDGTNFERNLNDDEISIISIPLKTAMLAFDIYVPSTKTIEKIEIRSADKETVYQTIDNLVFESGKYYKVFQNVEIQ